MTGRPIKSYVTLALTKSGQLETVIIIHYYQNIKTIRVNFGRQLNQYFQVRKTLTVCHPRVIKRKQTRFANFFHRSQENLKKKHFLFNNLFGNLLYQLLLKLKVYFYLAMSRKSLSNTKLKNSNVKNLLELTTFPQV